MGQRAGPCGRSCAKLTLSVLYIRVLRARCSNKLVRHNGVSASNRLEISSTAVPNKVKGGMALAINIGAIRSSTITKKWRNRDMGFWNLASELTK
jgi:hypothetical protein